MYLKDTEQNTLHENPLKKRGKTLSIVASSSIPALSTNVRTVLAMCGSASSDAAAISQVIQYDFGMTLNMLKAINSAFYSADKTPVISILHTLVLLGMDMVAHIVLDMPRVHPDEVNKKRSKEIATAWLMPFGQKVFGAHVATSIAKHADLDLDAVFYCTLFRDLGELVLSCAYPEGYRKYINSKGISSNEASLSRRTFGLSFDELTLHLVRKWNFPRCLTDVVRLKRRDLSLNGRVPRDVITLSGLVNEWCGHISTQGPKGLRFQGETRKSLIEIFTLSDKIINRIVRDELEGLKKYSPLYFEALRSNGFVQNILL